MKNNELTFGKRYNDELGEDREAFTISIFGDASTYLSTMWALLNVLGGTQDDSCGDRYFVCSLIKDMLPSFEQIKMIEDSQKTDKNQQKHETIL